MEKIRKIAIELYDIGNRNVGLGEFTWQLATHLSQRAASLRKEHGIVFYFIVPYGYKGCFGDDVRYIQLSHINRYLIRHYPIRMDLCHLTHQYSRIKYMSFARHNLMTIHDINFLYEKNGAKLKIYSELFKRRLEKVNRLSFISKFAQQDVAVHFAPSHPTRVIYNGVANLNRLAVQPRGVLERFALPDHFLLHISSLQPKKNAHLLVAMMAQLPQEHLVLIGNWSPEYGKRLKKRIVKSGLRNITPLDPVTNEEKAALYACCRGFLFPSLCEGFGLPPIEAMYFGKPVFLSQLTALPEIGGPVAYYYDSLTPQVMAAVTKKGLAAFYEDEEESAKRVYNWAQQFDWGRCVEEYIAYYLHIICDKEDCPIGYPTAKNQAAQREYIVEGVR